MDPLRVCVQSARVVMQLLRPRPKAVCLVARAGEQLVGFCAHLVGIALGPFENALGVPRHVPDGGGQAGGGR